VFVVSTESHVPRYSVFTIDCRWSTRESIFKLISGSQGGEYAGVCVAPCILVS
jgi:hypothetical protein